MLAHVAVALGVFGYLVLFYFAVKAERKLLPFPALHSEETVQPRLACDPIQQLRRMSIKLTPEQIQTIVKAQYDTQSN